MPVVKGVSIATSLMALVVLSGSASAQTVARVPLASPLAVMPGAARAVLVTGFNPSAGPNGEPFFGFLARSGGGAARIEALGFSSRPFDVSADPTSVADPSVAFSRCPVQVVRDQPGCSIFTVRAGREQPVPALVTQTPELAEDRLPAIYGGAVAFARFGVGTAPAVLMHRPTETRPLGRVPGGPAGVGQAGPTGLALRGPRLAYVWRWNPRPRAVRFSLRIHDLRRHRTRTLVTLEDSSHSLLGPAWDGSSLVFARRAGDAVRWWRYAPSSGRVSTARAPRAMSSFAVGRSSWYTLSVPRGTTCSTQRLCSVTERRAPRFQRSSLAEMRAG